MRSGASLMKRLRTILIMVLVIMISLPVVAGIQNIRVSNHTNSAVTISWITDSPASGEVRYSTSPVFSNPLTAWDVRNVKDRVYEGITHYVNLFNLQKETTYYFEVISGSERDDNNGSYHTFRTMKEPNAPPGICLHYGHVYYEGGTTPAEGAMVFLTLTRNGVPSHPLSRLIGSDGSFLFNIREARSTVTDNLFSSISAGVPISLEAICGAECTATSSFAYSQCTYDCGSLFLSSPLLPSSTSTLASTSTTTSGGVITTTTIPSVVTTSIPSATTSVFPPPPPPQVTSTTTTIGGRSTTTSSVKVSSTTTTVSPPPTTTSTVIVSTTTTSISSTTTTTADSVLWPLAYEEIWGTSKEGKLSTLRSFREEVLMKNELGREYVFLLYGNTIEVATLLMRDRSLRMELKGVIDECMPDIKALLEGRKVLLSRGKKARLESFLKQVEKKGSPELKKAVKKVRRDIRKNILFKQFGVTVEKRRLLGG